MNHSEILGTKTEFHAAVGKVTLKAWAANPPSDTSPEPGFVTTLRSHRESKVTGALEKAENVTLHREGGMSVYSLNDSFLSTLMEQTSI